LKKNEKIILEITSMSHEGDGVGRHLGLVVFVPMTAVGDVIEAKIVKVLKNRAYAIIMRIITPSSYRAQNDCPVFSRCGGCLLRHIEYQHELSVKSGWVSENVKRIGGVRDFTPDSPLPSPLVSRYRNKAQYPVRRVDGKIRAGFFRGRSHGLVPVDDCLLQPEFFGDITAEIIRFAEEHSIEPYDEATGTGTLRHIFIRHAEASDETMVCLVINEADFPLAEKLAASLQSRCPTVRTVLINENTDRTNVIFGGNTRVVTGPGYITDTLAGVAVRLSARSFYQVNRRAAEILYEAALLYAAPQKNDVLLDLYCGAGTIGLSMARAVKEVIGVEVVADAVRDAEATASLNGIKNARFIHADAALETDALIGKGVRPDIVIVDPPRKGLDEKLPASIAKLAPKKLVYISCNPATLARDIERLSSLGFSLEKARAVDLFPRTAHVEAIALLRLDLPCVK